MTYKYSNDKELKIANGIMELSLNSGIYPIKILKKIKFECN